MKTWLRYWWQEKTGSTWQAPNPECQSNFLQFRSRVLSEGVRKLKVQVHVGSKVGKAGRATGSIALIVAAMKVNSHLLD